MELGLDGSVAVVTGASKGIGLAIVKALVAEGGYVVAGARERSDELDVLVDEGHTSFVAADLGVAGGPDALVAAAMEKHQRLDVLVNNVGAAATRTDGFLSVTDDQWLSSITLNLMARFGVDAGVTFNLDLDGVPQRSQRTHRYHCGCQLHEVSSTRHNRAQRRKVRYHCCRCDGLLIYSPGER